jgi:UDP-glucose 4-epimerase
MNILIIGSEGFIGSHCIAHFSNAGDTVYGADLFEWSSKPYTYFKVSRLSPEFEELFRTHVFHAVINCAGSGNVPYSMTHPLIDFEANGLDVIRILDTIRLHNKDCRYIHLSSAAVYGNPARLPISESDPLHPLSPYGWHKLIAEQLCKEYTTVYGLQTAIIRPFSVYGPGLHKQMFWDLFQKINHAAANTSIELLGTGKESRDYIHVADLVKGIDLVLRKGILKAEMYNLASGIETTIEEVVAVFFGALEFAGKYAFNGHVREGDPLNWRADITKIKGLGFAAGFDIPAGMQHLAKHYHKKD